MVVFEVNWEIVLLGLGSFLAGVGSCLTGYVALKQASAEQKKAKEIVEEESHEDAEEVSSLHGR